MQERNIQPSSEMWRTVSITAGTRPDRYQIRSPQGAGAMVVHRMLLRLVLLVSIVGTVNLHAFAQTASTIDIRSLLREVEAKQKENSAKLERYSYALKRTVQELDDKGTLKKEKVYVYQVFPRRLALPVILLLSEDGKDLSAEKLAKEKVKVNDYWQKHKNDGAKNKPSKDAPWFETLDFTVLRNERYEGRDVVVSSFVPRSDFTPKQVGEKFMSALKGQVWIEPAEKVILKFQAELTNTFSVGGLAGFLSSLKPGTALTIENAPIGNGLWAATRFEFGSIENYRGVLWLPHTSRSHQVDEMSDYQPFDPDAKDLFAKQ